MAVMQVVRQVLAEPAAACIHYIILHALLNQEWETHSGANERLIGGCKATTQGCTVLMIHQPGVIGHSEVMQVTRQVGLKLWLNLVRLLCLGEGRG
jgi:hypothetical protein